MSINRKTGASIDLGMNHLDKIRTAVSRVGLEGEDGWPRIFTPSP